MEINEAIHRAFNPGPSMGGAASKCPTNLTAVSHDHLRLSLTTQPVENDLQRQSSSLVRKVGLFLSIVLGAEDI